MEARIKRLFHRKKGNSFDQALQHRQGSAKEVESTPNLNTQLYDSASSAGPPQTESYSSDINPARQNRKSSLSNHGQEELLSEHVPHGMIAASVLPKTRRNKRQTSQTIQSDSSADKTANDGPQQETKRLDDFSNLSLEDKDGIGSILSHPSLYGETGASGRQYEATSKQFHLIPDGSDQRTFPRKSEPAQNIARVPIRESRSLDGHNLLRRVDNPSGNSAKPGSRDDNIRSTLAETPNSKRLSNNLTSGRTFEKHPQSTKGASINEALQANHGGRPHDSFVNEAQDSAAIILDRSKSTSVDTEVIETIAPAVVHETVHQDIHHVRQEVITREIHHHDIYHRVLPVIDVEVLPARHFLPVEGGGLVEISPSEVPGRAQNWVIAETASRIPSNDPAPKASTRFSAREFLGDEGDSKRYTTAEGFEKTEETWVHPPGLETGGRDTGQTWPVIFGNDIRGDDASGLSDPGQFSRKKSLRASTTIPSSTSQIKNA